MDIFAKKGIKRRRYSNIENSLYPASFPTFAVPVFLRKKMSHHHFQPLLSQFRQQAHSQRDKGDRFEKLMQGFLMTDPQYAAQFDKVWLWNEFPSKDEFGNNDTGIDLVAQTKTGAFWAIQCKCFQKGATIDKPAVDTFLSTSSRTFRFDQEKSVAFAHRLWIDTTGRKWGTNAEEAVQNQHPPAASSTSNNRP